MSESPRLLPGGLLQVPDGDGEEAVQAFISAMPDWRCDIGRRLDRIVTRTAPEVRKAVKWSSPFYGAALGRSWFLSVHCYQNFVRVAFFDGTMLHPPPPGPSKIGGIRYYDIRERGLDEAQFAGWVEQACVLPGWTP